MLPFPRTKLRGSLTLSSVFSISSLDGSCILWGAATDVLVDTRPGIGWVLTEYWSMLGLVLFRLLAQFTFVASVGTLAMLLRSVANALFNS